MTQCEILFDGDHVQTVLYRANSNYTVVSFGSLVSIADGRRAFGKDWAAKNGVDLIGFVGKDRNWYPNAETSRAVDAAKRYIDRPCLTYGSSMGGYGALRFSRQLGASAALAFSPQMTIDPAVTGDADKRYTSYFDPELHSDMLLRQDHLCANSYAFYDPTFPMDTAQVNFLEDGPNLIHAPLRYLGHGTIEAIASSAVCGPVFEDAVAGHTQNVINRLQDRRTDLPFYYARLCKVLRDTNHPKLAQAVAKKGLIEHETDWKITREYSTVLSQQSFHQQALSAFAPMMELYPKSRNVHFHYTTLLIEAGDYTQAAVMATQEVEHADTVPNRFLLIKSLVLGGEIDRAQQAIQSATDTFPSQASRFQGLMNMAKS